MVREEASLDFVMNVEVTNKYSEPITGNVNVNGKLYSLFMVLLIDNEGVPYLFFRWERFCE